MENKKNNLKKVLEQYFEEKVDIKCENEEFCKLMQYLNERYKLSTICFYDVELSVDKEHHNKFYKFSYNIENKETDLDTTIYIFFAFESLNHINSTNFGIVFDEVTIGEKDYPYGKTVLYLLDGTVKTQYFDYNENTSIQDKNNYIKKLIKK